MFKYTNILTPYDPGLRSCSFLFFQRNSFLLIAKWLGWCCLYCFVSNTLEVIRTMALKSAQIGTQNMGHVYFTNIQNPLYVVCLHKTFTSWLFWPQQKSVSLGGNLMFH